MRHRILTMLLFLFAPAAMAACRILGTMERIGNGEVPVCKYFDAQSSSPASPACVLPGKRVKKKDGLTRVTCPTVGRASLPNPEDQEERATRGCSAFCDPTVMANLPAPEKTPTSLDEDIHYEFSAQ